MHSCGWGTACALSDIRLSIVLVLVLRQMPSTTTSTRTNASSHRSWRCFCDMGSHDANALPSSNEEGMLRPAASAGVVRLTAAALFRRLGGAVCLLVACCLWASQAHAHEIGLSVVELQVEQEHLSVQLTFAQSEVEALVAGEKTKLRQGQSCRRQNPQELDWRPSH